MRGLSSLFFLLLPLIASGAAPDHPSKPSAAPNNNSARFEGIVDMRLTMESGGGDLKLFISGDKARLNMQVTVNPLPQPIEMNVLVDAKTPHSVFLVNDQQKTYSEINLADADKNAGPGDMEKYAVKVLGKDKLLGYACSHITLTRKNEVIDAWITSDMPDVYAVLKRLQEANPQIGEAALFRALEETGHAGVPMRCIVIREGQRVTTEVLKVDRKALAANQFAIPAGFQKTEATTGAAPEQAEEMKKIIQGALQGQ